MSDPNQEFQPPPPPSVTAEAKAPRATKLIPYGIGVFAVGLIVLVLGIAHVLPGGIGTGILFALWGLLLFAFSFIPLPQVKGDEEPAMSGLQKVAGIFYEPTRVFKSLRAHPTWLAPFLVIVIVSGVYSVAFIKRLTPERIVEYTMDKLEQSPIKPPPEAMAKAREDAMQAATQPIQRVQTFARSFAGVFILIAFVAAVCLLAVLAFGGRMNYWQSFAVVAYSYLPYYLIGKLVSTIILFIKAPEDIHPVIGQETLLTDNLGILFKPADHPALWAFCTAIGVLSFYSLWLKAKGLANAGTKVSSTAGWGVAITVWLVAVLIGVAFATLFSSFVS